ncbi:HlyD family secretion protein [Pseudomonas abietaniphila]|uniref:Membrane fusion protein, multidrug efflux system n=1 Tax=Pseudomonas abietaniphila TaxID=89065 RepID=A0A1G7S0J9_9PSED|nr:HlyD family secretion protein [Pseudomonas abietaniphila]SDG16464.1 membrane fusion protein, multidrug efflux system [Pseudomonas abietaniphila]
MSMTSKQTLALCGAVIAVATVGIYVFTGTGGRQSTNDAYIAADYSNVAPKVAGFISQVLVEDNQQVKAGQLLAVIDDRDFLTALAASEADVLTAKAQYEQASAVLQRQASVIAQAEAALAASKAEVTFAEQEQARYAHLAGMGAGTVQNAQQARNRIDTARARQNSAVASLAADRKQVDILTAQQHAAEAGLKRAQAAHDQAQLQVSYTRIVAPVDGMVGERAVRVGNYVSPGARLLSVVPLNQVYVVGNFQETQLTDVTPGQAVQVRVDTFPGETLTGRVESVAPATGVTFAAIKPDNATGNFTKVVQRLPVKIVLDAQQPVLSRLRVGMSVDASIDTHAAPRAEVSVR